MKWKDILTRALKTFVQAFIGSLAVTLPNADYTDKSVLISMLIGAIACGVSAVMNMVVNYFNKDKE